MPLVQSAFHIFQSTLPREERRSPCQVRLYEHYHFNPRSHDRSDCCKVLCFRLFLYFNPRFPREERCRKLDITRRQSDFNPRSHKRSDVKNAAYNVIQFISIHAPTIGATIYFPSEYKSLIISIHAPTIGATLCSSSCVITLFYFNPRSHERSDATKTRAKQRQAISIHAPTIGATVEYDVFVVSWDISIHAPTIGATARRGPVL